MRNKGVIIHHDSCITGIPASSDVDISYVKDNCKTMCHFVATCYMSTCPSFNVSRSYLEEEPHESDIDYILNNIGKCPETSWRLISEEDTIYLSVIHGPDGPLITIMAFNAGQQSCSTWSFIIKDNAIGTYTPVPFIIPTENYNKTKNAVRQVMEHAEAANTLIVSHMRKGIQRMVENQNHIADLVTTHTKLEMRIFRKILNSTLNHMCVFSIVKAMGVGMFDPDPFLEMNYIEYYVNLDRSLFPTISMSNREWDSVDEYVSNSHLFRHDKINIIDVIKHQRFGKQLGMVTDDGHHLNCDIFIKDDELMISMIYEIDRYYTLFISTTYNSITDMNILHDIQSIRMDIWTKDAREIKSSVGELEQLIPEPLRDSKYINMLAIRLLEIYIVIHDRPNRGKFDPDPSHDSVDEKTHDIIIRRILGPMEFEPKRKLAAREKGDRKTNNANTDRDANYVVEYWERRGHWRKTPKGSNVWIAPTMCQRHLPLSDKDVILKL